ncbi:MAG: DUF6265 family protein [Gammaproteobacteria bacterium]|nr:DUF6265 family protein [Gammaproteobacteria bacterium]
MNRPPFAALLAFFIACPAIAGVAGESAPARVADLGWISGSWVGQLGDRTLEETWSEPGAGTMAALVRMTRDDTTVMVELLFIREENEELVLHVQPWNPERQPGMPGYQKLVLAELGENRARFRGTVEGEGFRTLTYSRPALGLFRIEVETQEGAFSVDLSPVGDSQP